MAQGVSSDRALVARAIGWTTLDRWGVRVTTTLVFVVLTRLLEPPTFGLVAIGSVFITIVTAVIDNSFGAVIIARQRRDARFLNTAFWSSVVTSAVLAGSGVLLAPLVSRLVEEPELTTPLRVMCLSLFLQGLYTTQRSVLQMDMDYKSLAKRSFASTVAGAVVGISLAFQGAEIWALVGQLLTQSVVKLVMVWSVSSWRPGLAVERESFRAVLGFGATTGVTGLLGQVSRNADNLLVGAFLGPAALGFYTLSYRVLSVVQELFIGVVGAVSLPTLSRLAHDRDRMLRAFYSGVALVAAIAGPVFVLIGVLAAELVHVVFGAKWEASVEPLRWLAVVGVVSSLGALQHGLFMAVRRPRLELGLVIATTTLDIVVFAIAVRHGIVVLAAALAGRSLLTMPLRLVVLRRAAGLSLRQYARTVVAPLTAALLGGGAAALVRLVPALAEGEPIVRLLAAGAVGVLVHLLALCLLARELVGQVLAVLPRVGRSRRRAAPAPGDASAPATPEQVEPAVR